MLLKSVFAFLVGGGFCVLAQLLIDKTKLSPARILVSFVILGIFLGGIGLYPLIFEFSGCGISLPLIGYGIGWSMPTPQERGIQSPTPSATATMTAPGRMC